jgi:hypothetical protein
MYSGTASRTMTANGRLTAVAKQRKKTLKKIHTSSVNPAILYL